MGSFRASATRLPGQQLCDAVRGQIVVHDDVEQQTRYQGTISCLGLTRDFRLTAQELASNEKLKAAIFNAAPPEADIKTNVDILRRAIIKVSQPSYRETTTSAGWTEDGSKFLVPGGYVDDQGYHDFKPDCGAMEVDLVGCEGARWLGMRTLEPELLNAVKRHVATELMQSNEPKVMRALIGAVALAPLLRFGSTGSRPVIWLKGLTGSGKTFAAGLAMNFFGDFPASECGRIISWNSTGNYLQSLGYFHKDALFLVDDFKLDTTRHYDVTRLLQNYADGTGRGRLRSDATMNVVRPIRGLLVSTGEDFPMQNASGLARSIVIPVPNREKNLTIGKKCREMSPLYRGLMADFIADLIRNNKGVTFVERLDHWRQFYYEKIAGRQNDARIAGNHALLAAAFELFADYLRDVWTEAKEAAREFAEVDLVDLVEETAGAVEEEQASEVFLKTLGELFEGHVVRVDKEGTRRESTSRAKLVGTFPSAGVPSLYQVRDETPINLCLALALAQVQVTLAKQGKPQLSVSEKTLIAQLTDAGLLLDEENKVLTKDAKGVKSKQCSLDGKRKRYVRIRVGSICPADRLVDPLSD